MNGWWLAAGSVITLISGYFLKIWSWFIADIRLDSQLSYACYEEFIKDEYKKIKFFDWLPYDPNTRSIPPQLKFYIWHRVPFIFTMSEEEMKAGSFGTRTVAKVTTLRPLKNKVIKLIREKTYIEKDEVVYVMINTDKYYQITTEVKIPYKKPELPENVSKQLTDLCAAYNKKPFKRGLLLHGPAGNGKTSIVRYLASELKCHIYVPMILKSTTDGQFITKFLDIPIKTRGIILLEDFDNHFKGRDSVYGQEANMNFSTVLNVLDGLYCDLSNKIIIMTTNHIDQVDPALKHRPSRFDMSIHVGNPDYNSRYRILEAYGQNGHTDQLANLTDGQSGAIVCEIAQHRFGTSLEKEVNDIIASFN